MLELFADPIGAAEYFANIEPSNFLAHSIRKIEQEFIENGGAPYRIFTQVSSKISNAITLFCKGYCIINLPPEDNERRIRLALGHELGHIVFRFDDLKNSRENNTMAASEQEELFAWAFAYGLIKAKSNQHRDDRQITKFIYKDGELEKELLAVIRDKCPAIADELTEYLNLTADGIRTASID